MVIKLLNSLKTSLKNQKIFYFGGFRIFNTFSRNFNNIKSLNEMEKFFRLSLHDIRSTQFISEYFDLSILLKRLLLCIGAAIVANSLYQLRPSKTRIEVKFNDNLQNRSIY